MATHNLKLLIGGGLLAALLSACGGGGGGSSTQATAPATRAALPAPIADVVDQSNSFTDAFCPQASANGGAIDPQACFQEALGQSGGDSGYTLSLNPVVQQFCPDAAKAFDGTGTFSGEMLSADFVYNTDVSFDGSASFPAACLQEAAGNFQQFGDLIGASNPITQAICPQEAADGQVDPANCFAEATSQGTLPSGGGSGGGSGGSGGSSLPGADQLTSQLCPQTGSQPMGTDTPVNCLNETSRVYVTIIDMLTKPNPLTAAFCPQDAADGRIDPMTCFSEAVGGGAGGLPSNPLPGPDVLFAQFCPDTASGEIGPSTPIDCLQEAGGNFGGLQDMLLGANPLTEQFCPNAAQTSPIDPAACFTEALETASNGGTPGGGANPLQPVLDQFCPQTGMAAIGPTTPVDCLNEAASNFGDIQDMLLGANPLTENLCPQAAMTSPIDPAACFMEAANSGGDQLKPALDPLLAQFCPNTAAGSIGPSTPVDCLQEAGGNFGNIQDLLLGSNPLTDTFCPNTAQTSPIDPAACLTEASSNGLPGGAGGGSNPLKPLLDQFCPQTGAGALGPTTPVDCLTEAGGNFGNIQDMLLGANPLTENLCPQAAMTSPIDPAACFMEAANSGGDQLKPALDPLLAQFCPNTAAGSIGPSTPVDCLQEAGGNFGNIQDLLLGSNPLTDTFCPNTAQTSPIDPAACLTEASSNGLPGGAGGGSNPLQPLLDQFCPQTGAGALGPTTPVDCLTEAGGNFGNIQDLLLGSNPLTDAFCPNAAQTSPIDPAACFTEAVQTGSDQLSGAQLQQVMSQFCPNTAQQPVGPSTATDCLTEAGGDYAALQQLLSPLMTSNALTDQICPNESADGQVDPAGCFIESLDNLNLIDTSSLGLFPNCPLIDTTNDSGNLSLTLGIGCLLDQASSS